MYKNHEGYSDPTAGAALGEIMKEYRQNRKKVWRKQAEIKARPKVYIVSRYAGDVDNNISNAIRYCRFAIEKKKIPIASHLLYPQMLDDDNPDERELGTVFGFVLLSMCDEVWVFGKEISSGMQAEIDEARRLKKPIKFVEVI